MGTRTSNFEATRKFFDSTLELPVGNERSHFVRFDLPDWGSIEVFDAKNDPYTHFTTGPVLGFQVADFDSALRDLVSSGCPLIGDIAGDPDGYRWQHFRGPDDLVFAIIDYPNRPAPNAPVGPLRVTKLVWMGISTPNFHRLARFYTRTLCLPAVEETPDLIECRLPDNSSVEAFRRGSEMDHPHFRTGPVPCIGVMDIDSALRCLRDRGIAILQVRRRETFGWAHFRAPDGNIYAIKQSALGYRW
ncbi:MAG: VOC family protein [Nitrososphaerales archaeon]